MPLLPEIDPKAAITAEAKVLARKMGTALILALFGERFGRSPLFEGISEGLQNFNGYIIGDDGSLKAFLSFLRFGQGEIVDETHQRKILSSINLLVEAGFPTPGFLAGCSGEYLLTLPENIIIDGKIHPVPEALRATSASWAVAQEYINGTTLPNPVKTLEQARAMGQLHGRYMAACARVFHDVGTMENPVSLQNLQRMLCDALGLGDDMPLETAVNRLSENIEHKIFLESRNLTQLEAGEDKQRRRRSLILVKEFLDSLVQGGWAQHMIQSFTEAETLWREKGFDVLPDARIHGDFHSGNMFAEGVMYDMGWMGDGKRLFDLCQPIAVSCHKDGRFWREAAQAFIRGVQEHITLTREELEAFPDMLYIVYLRSVTTRFVSIVASPETQFVLKSPLELQRRRDGYRTAVLEVDKNWALEQVS